MRVFKGNYLCLKLLKLNYLAVLRPNLCPQLGLISKVNVNKYFENTDHTVRTRDSYLHNKLPVGNYFSFAY